MMRLTTFLLCLLLAAAAAGRYKAEEAVREKKREIERLERAKMQAVADIQLLRAEVAFLENPDRLAKIAGAVTSLSPLTGAQVLTADDYRVAFNAPERPRSQTPGENATRRPAPIELALADRVE